MLNQRRFVSKKTAKKMERENQERERKILDLERERMNQERKEHAEFVEREESASKRRKVIKVTRQSFLDSIGGWHDENPEKKSASEAVDDFLEMLLPILPLTQTPVTSSFFVYPYFYYGNTAEDIAHELKVRDFRVRVQKDCLCVEFCKTSDDLEILMVKREKRRQS